MKFSMFLFFIFLLLVLTTSLQSQVNRSDMARISNDASYDFSNLKMYKDEAAWRGKNIGFSGIVQKTPVIAKTKGPYIQVAGQTAAGFVNVVVLLDSPLPTADNYGNQVPLITPGMDVRVVVQLKGLQNFTEERGYVMSLPTADGIFIFSKDDYSMTNPLWPAKR